MGESDDLSPAVLAELLDVVRGYVVRGLLGRLKYIMINGHCASACASDDALGVAPPCRALRAPAGRGSGGGSVATPPFFRPTRYPPSPTLPPAPRLPAARAQARALAHRISVCALSSEAPIDLSLE